MPVSKIWTGFKRLTMRVRAHTHISPSGTRVRGERIIRGRLVPRHLLTFLKHSAWTAGAKVQYLEMDVSNMKCAALS